jgi:hypothetical protein
MEPLLRFDVRGESALACYFLMANWGGQGPVPFIDTLSNPIGIVFSVASRSTIDDIRASLKRAEAVGGAVTQSARAFSALLERKAETLRLSEPRVRPESCVIW